MSLSLNRIISLCCAASHFSFYSFSLMINFTLIYLPVLLFSTTDKPLVNLSLGRTLDALTLKEGIDLFFECSIDSNPRPYKIRWLHQVIGISFLTHILYFTLHILPSSAFYFYLCIDNISIVFIFLCR